MSKFFSSFMALTAISTLTIPAFATGEEGDINRSGKIHCTLPFGGHNLQIVGSPDDINKLDSDFFRKLESLSTHFKEPANPEKKKSTSSDLGSNPQEIKTSGYRGIPELNISEKLSPEFSDINFTILGSLLSNLSKATQEGTLEFEKEDSLHLRSAMPIQFRYKNVIVEGEVAQVTLHEYNLLWHCAESGEEKEAGHIFEAIKDAYNDADLTYLGEGFQMKVSASYHPVSEGTYEARTLYIGARDVGTWDKLRDTQTKASDPFKFMLGLTLKAAVTGNKF